MRRAALLVCAAFLGCLTALAEETNLERIQKRVEIHEQQLRTVAARQKELELSIREQEKRLVELRERAQNLGAELRRVREEQAETQQQLADIEKRSRAVSETSLQRIRVMYTRRRDVSAMQLLWFNDSDTFAANAYALAKVRRYDMQLLNRLRELRIVRSAALSRLEKLAENRDLLARSLEREQQSIAAGVQKSRNLRAALKNEQQGMEEALTALRAEALRLETVVRSLTGEDDAPRVNGSSRKNIITSHGEADHQRFNGSGLEGVALVLPVKGKIARPFGKYKIEGFNDFVRSKGLEYSAPARSEVFAVAEGRVIYHGRMPGYGTILIVDHGKRCYSLYGRLGQVNTAVGSLVSGGQVIAGTGSPDAEGRNFYFEIRKNGMPVDPSRYLSGKRQ